MTAPAQLDRPDTDEDVAGDRPWVAIVWNDPVNVPSPSPLVPAGLVPAELVTVMASRRRSR